MSQSQLVQDYRNQLLNIVPNITMSELLQMSDAAIIQLYILYQLASDIAQLQERVAKLEITTNAVHMS